MPLPRFRLRTLMIAVAVMALATYGSRLLWLRQTYRVQAEMYARNAEVHLALAATQQMFARRLPTRDGPGASPGLKSQAETEERLVAHFRRLAAKYRYAASHPWLSIKPDPSEPK